ncbi:adenine deaminase [Desulfobacula phenolica]|uniref:Adenine deaminase n=1 Tax=Desulfobacula phenolica TaxID=90732 RepID=A0A1H2IYQ2_9BACT|nr:adenine deaminase [Desulfobacula phenolica]SDU49270.1 Adenine deaminase [Desulfobacula phenolica]
MKNFLHNLAVARGEVPADLLIKNVRVINVISGEIHTGNVAVCDGRFIGFGEYDAKKIIDAQGLYMSPGFIDGHMHFESTMLTLPEFSRAVLQRGTTAVIIDPHEIANVLGLEGIRYVLDSIKQVPLDVFVMLPSCVPATPLETSGANIGHKDLCALIHKQGVAGIGEMMNYPAVINGDEEVHQRIAAAKWKKIDGHAPGISAKDLNAYIFSRIDSDHESTSAKEAKEKLQKGMHILIREGTSERNLEDLIGIVTKENSWHFSFATDDKHPDDLLEEGHIDHSLRKSISLGMAPITAYQIATINTANHYGLRNIGAIKPRFWADFVLLSDYKQVKIEAVYKKGVPVLKNQSLICRPLHKIPKLRGTMNPGELSRADFKIPAAGSKIRVIDILQGQIVTDKFIATARIKNNYIESDISRDILKIVVIERHNATGRIGKAFVRGLGLKRGAIGSTVAHDAHNIVIAGTNDVDMFAAFQRIKKMQGGLVVVDNNQVVADLPLPVAGLLSNNSFEKTAADLKILKQKVKILGSDHPSLFMILSFLCLSPVPKLKITDLGLVDVEKFAVTSLFADDCIK